MASINTSHHQDGGVLLYSGELVLLFCDKVNCDIDNVANTNGRLYLTTHRIVYTSQPINQNPRLMSLAAPFYAMFDLGLEQPVFGANLIKGKVRTNSSQNTSALTQNQFTFKLKFNKGGACEFGRALSIAARQASQVAQQSGWSNNYSFSNSPASQFYAAPSNIYQPNYPVGFALPHQQFNEVPQSGTIYYQTAPPPYPGLVTAHQVQQQQGPYAQAYPVASGNSFGSVYEVNQQQNPMNSYSPYSAPPVYPQPGFNPQQPGYGGGQNQNQSNPPPYASNQQYAFNNQYSGGPQQGYQPGNTYQQQYPTVLQQSGNVPQSNTTYPNIPSYSDIPKKEN